MVVNPAPMLWTPYHTVDIQRNGHTKQIRHGFCKYSKRFELPCATNRKQCKYCYMKQQNLVSSEVKRKCDRCGFDMTGADKLSYVKIENRYGSILGKAELCEACASMFLTWLGNKDFEENFYGDLESKSPEGK